MVYIALLRGINLAGRNQVAMVQLGRMFQRLGFSDARTMLQSGNVVFSASGKTAPQLEALLESETQKRFKLVVKCFVRTAKHLKAVIRSNPFGREAREAPSYLHVFFFKATPSPQDIEQLRKAIPGRETINVDGKTAYVMYPEGMGRSKLGSSVIERHLKTSATARNWNTITKLVGIAEQM